MVLLVNLPLLLGVVVIAPLLLPLLLAVVIAIVIPVAPGTRRVGGHGLVADGCGRSHGGVQKGNAAQDQRQNGDLHDGAVR